MNPAAGVPSTWPVLPIETIAQLANILNLSLGDLCWLADCRMLERKTGPGPLRNYNYRWLRKRDGSARLIESPKPRLKAIQRFLLRRILE
ncbi:MAG TPA: RNA-directed DNA polymerase, partial [Verrucomicrobiae bacterium]|nr:RNA-directed DNA polymerase [Verrucomicrobiae bacterium]